MAPVRTLMVDRGRLIARLADARERGDAVFGTIRPEALYDRPISERHRLVFYLGHLEAFDWNLIARRTLGVASFHETFDRLFAFGIDPTGGGLLNWNLRNRNNQFVASGVYFYHIEAPDGKTKVGRFTVVNFAP